MHTNIKAYLNFLSYYNLTILLNINIYINILNKNTYFLIDL